MNQDALINKLLELDVIRRTGIRGRYYIRGAAGNNHRRDEIIRIFGLECGPYRYVVDSAAVSRALQRAFGVYEFDTQPAPERPVLRTLHRDRYHADCSIQGQRDFVQEALANIAPDEDGIRRSFGIEYEIYALTAEQEDKLAKLLDTMPTHVVERDGSLSDTGCEIVFAPVDAGTYIDIVDKLAQFVRDNGVKMNGSGWTNSMAGMHTTYGISQVSASKSDLQIRLNRLALAVKSVGTRDAIKNLFGRDFGHYRELPGQTSDENALASCSHGNAFSTNGRPATCWENRLLAWNCNAAKVVEFFKATEFVFNRTFEASDFMKVFALLGNNVDGE